MAPGQIDTAIKEAEVVGDTVEKLHAESDQLFGDISDHLADVSPLVKSLSVQTAQIKELEKYTKYLYFISQLEDLR